MFGYELRAVWAELRRMVHRLVHRREGGRPYGGKKATSRYFRAVKGIHDQGRAVNVTIKAMRAGGSTVHTLEAVQEVDHLTDLAIVVGTEKHVRTTEVLHRLKARNHAVYEHWTGITLKDLLAEYDEETGLYDGYPVVKLESVQRALEYRGDEIADAQ